MTSQTFESFLEETLPLTASDVLQLLHAPQESASRLRDVAEQADPYRYPGNDDLFVVGGFGYLDAKHAVPHDSFCQGFKNEAGRWDALRCRYRIGDWDYEVAANEVMRSIRISGPDLGDRSIDTVRRVAEVVFPRDEDDGLAAAGFAPTTVGDHDGRLFGLHDRSVREITKVRWWRDDLVWYQDGSAVGFIVPVPDGTEVVNAKPVSMRTWLTPYVDVESFDHWVQGASRQLIEPPNSSTHELEAAAAGQPISNEVLLLATDAPQAADFLFLLPDLHMPADALCLGFRREGNGLDVVRCRYEKNATAFELALKRDQQALWISERAETDDLHARAASVARRLLRTPVPELVVVQQTSSLAFGTIAYEGAGRLLWWSTATAVGFIANVREEQNVGSVDDWFADTQPGGEP